MPLPTPTSSLPNILPPASTGSFSSAVPTPSIVVYNNKANFGTNITGRVFPAQNQTKLFSWTLDSAAMPIDISWYGKVIDESPEAFNLSRATKIATARFSDNRASSEFLARTLPSPSITPYSNSAFSLLFTGKRRKKSPT